MMSYNDATKKKKIYSWNKIIPLDKPMVARVDEIFMDSSYVQVSIAYFTKTDNMEEDDIQKHLIKKFNDNKVLISLLKNICYKNQIDNNDFWIKIIYPLDELRRNDDINISLLEYLKNNKEIICNLVKDNYLDFEKIIEEINKIGEIKSQKITSKIGIISIDGIQPIFMLVKKVVEENTHWKYSLKYESAPYYILESNSSNSTTSNHELFINKLKENTSDKLFIKVEYMAKVE
jgi:translation initiation factor 2 alpha subunit (eIF-2alpha)